LILQVTLGCSHNRCTFCGMYRSKRFRVRPEEEVAAEIREARRQLGPEVPRVFLADGDACCLSARRLLAILAELHAAFPGLQRVSSYANARDLLAKSEAELAELREHGLKLLFMGLESGDEETLAAVEKGASVEEIVEAARRARRAGIALSAMVLIGLAGQRRSLVHARASAEALNRMEPAYTALLTAIPVPGTPFFAAVEAGQLTLPDPRESLLEIRELLAGLRYRTYFTCNHASNYLPLRGKLPGAGASLLAALDQALAGEIPLKPEWLRGL
jgi:radical SAM superfamily enzyme YgiQ (UPF0313 family)